ncbi:ABC transporter permease [Sulfurifustis variabilis]|uniref:ABC transporter permease n=1 Tax=Sulfurifustis variabilis TaxID=1675686 RepID=A0A1B4V2K9_9GAMM|nr:MFS transporter [Sulfurifustis variabilis]BAU47776.1 ABC transporter permease [Sulfurifustis variabilis]
MTDRGVLYAAAFLRALATGLMGVLLGIYLAKRGFAAGEIGLVIGAGLTGAALSTLIVTFLGDRLGRRRALIVLGLLGAAGGVALILTESVLAASVVAFIGMVNGMGRDRGAALVLEQAILPATTGDAGRTRAFAWYNVLQDIGHALGGALAATPTALRAGFAVDELAAFHVAVGVYAALLLAGSLLYVFLTPASEAPAARDAVRLSPQSRRIIARISLLFALDSLAGGFLGTALLSYFFYERFGAGEAVIAGLFFLARGLNALSHLGAAWLAARIGLVNTMVYTHIPSSLLLMTVPFAPGFAVAAALFLLREALVEMDVPTRQSYVMAMVRPEERTFASGVTHLVRMAGWAVAPFAAGFLMQGLALGAPLYIGGAMKIAYDLALYRAFRHLKPPEERAR